MPPHAMRWVSPFVFAALLPIGHFFDTNSGD
jgi:hypothetical protein